MLKKMRRRFILAAMAAFGAVMLAVAAGINVTSYFQTAAMQDRQIENLLRYERMDHGRPERKFPPAEEMPGRGPEAEFTTRFFVVHCDISGKVQKVSRDHISSVDDGTARVYAEEILAMGREKGYHGEYRYLVSMEDTGITILFLNVSNDLHFMRSLLFISLCTGFISLAAVFVLILILSGYAIRPYTRNIERQKRFITDAGHELKTPLTSIATSADIAAMEHEGDEWIAHIQKQTVRLTRLVGDLVALSRLDEEVPFPEKAAFSLSDAAWETAEPFAALAKAKEKRYRQNIEEGLSFHGDRNAVQQMLSILLDNAVRYSDEKGEIHLDIYRRMGRNCIEVYNTCTLPETLDPDRLFDRFYRADESRSDNTGGTGIGLSMAQAIAEAHGGRIEAKRSGGNGIRFKVIL